MKETIEELYREIEILLRQYKGSLNGYSDEKFKRKRDENVWSLREMYEHLYLSTVFFSYANIRRCLEKREGGTSGEPTDMARKLLREKQFPPVKMQVPAEFSDRPMIPKTQEEYIPLFTTMIEDAKNYVPLIKADDGMYRTKHPVFGFLNAAEWYKVLMMHLKHHLNQKDALELKYA